MNQKGFTPIIFISVLRAALTGIIGGALYIKKASPVNTQSTSSVVSQTSSTPFPSSSSASDPTLDWKVYENSTFKISYPPTWRISPDEIYPALFPPGSESGIPSEHITFTIMDELYGQNADYCYGPEKPITIAGIRGVSIDETENPSTVESGIDKQLPRMRGCQMLYCVYFPAKDRIIHIDSCPEFKEPLHEILNTLILK